MKKIIVFVSILFITYASQSQQLRQVTFTSGSQFAHFGILIDGNVLLRISAEGKILEYGLEEQSVRSANYYAPKLVPYLGRVEKYGQEADSLARGRERNIGSAQITYYASYEEEYRRGKIRAIGNILFDYYNHQANAALKGKIKLFGRNMIDFYSSFENDAVKGKPKSIGGTNIVYYTTFDDKAVAGKVKMIGPNAYSWYTSLDRKGMAGVLKTGQPRQQVGEITYIVQ
jgi:hypothetical protein